MKFLLLLFISFTILSISNSLVTRNEIEQFLQELATKKGRLDINQIDIYTLYSHYQLSVSSTFQGPLICLRLFSNPSSFDFDSLSQIGSICKPFEGLVPSCLSPEELFSKFGYHSTETVSFEDQQLHFVIKNIVQIASNQQCLKAPARATYSQNSFDEDESEGPSSEVWLYSFISVTLISLSSLMGLFLIPCLGHRWSVYILESMVSLGVGVLLGDSFLHLIPQAFGAHSHEEESPEELAEEESHFKSMFVGLTIVATIYLPYLFEKNVVEYNGWSHSHNITETIEASDTAAISQEESPLLKDSSSSEKGKNINHTHSHSHSHSHSHLGNTGSANHSIGIFILIANLAHNIVDGIAIGASFAVSTETGLSTSLAIFFHEVPHEASDFVILLRAGYSKKRAILLNCVNQITAFIGVIPGVYLGNESQAVSYVIASTAGLFIYLSLVDLMPMLEFRKGKDSLISMFWRNAGILLGIAFMIAISLVEEELLSDHDHDHDHDHNTTMYGY